MPGGRRENVVVGVGKNLLLPELPPPLVLAYFHPLMPFCSPVYLYTSIDPTAYYMDYYTIYCPLPRPFLLLYYKFYKDNTHSGRCARPRLRLLNIDSFL